MADREGLTFVSLRSLRNALREVEESRDHGQRVRTLTCGRVLIPPFVFKQSLFSLIGTWPLKLGASHHGGGVRTPLTVRFSSYSWALVRVGRLPVAKSDA